MKSKKTLRNSVSLAAALAAMSTATVMAGNQTDELAKQFKPILVATPSAELPAKATSLVIQAEPAVRAETAAAVVRVVSEINPAAAPIVVGAISRAEPSLASKAVDEAVTAQPTLRKTIVQSATPATVLAANTTSGPGSIANTPSNGRRKGGYNRPGFRPRQ